MVFVPMDQVNECDRRIATDIGHVPGIRIGLQGIRQPGDQVVQGATQRLTPAQGLDSSGLS